MGKMPQHHTNGIRRRRKLTPVYYRVVAIPQENASVWKYAVAFLI